MSLATHNLSHKEGMNVKFKHVIAVYCSILVYKFQVLNMLTEIVTSH